LHTLIYVTCALRGQCALLSFLVSVFLLFFTDTAVDGFL
jgi:hypothetical protein